MNTRESVFALSPNEKRETCVKFNIDNQNIPFAINDVAVPNRIYTLSFWAKSESNGEISIFHDKTFLIDQNWKRCNYTYTSKEDFIYLYFSTGTHYIYNIMLESGTVPTDWTPNPDDNEIDAESIKKEIEASVISIVNTKELEIRNEINEKTTVTTTDENGNIISSSISDALISHVQDLRGVKNTVSDLKLELDDGVLSLTDRVSKAEQTANGFKQTVEETYATKDSVTKLNETLSSSIEQTAGKIDLIITDGSTESSVTMTNEMLEAVTKQFVVRSDDGNSVIIQDGKIKAHSITAEYLSIEDNKTNYVIDPSCEKGLYDEYAEPLPFVEICGNAPYKYLQITPELSGIPKPYSTNFLLNKDYYDDFTVSEGDEILVKWDALNADMYGLCVEDYISNAYIVMDVKGEETTSLPIGDLEITHNDNGWYTISYTTTIPHSGTVSIYAAASDPSSSDEQTPSIHLKYWFRQMQVYNLSDKTFIVGGDISTSKLSVKSIKSKNYIDSDNNVDDYGVFSNSGIMFDMSGYGSIKAKNFAVDSSGNAYFRGEVIATSGKFTGAINAESLSVYSSISMVPGGFVTDLNDIWGNAIQVIYFSRRSGLAGGTLNIMEYSEDNKMSIRTNAKIEVVRDICPMGNSINLGASGLVPGSYPFNNVYANSIYEDGTLLSNKYLLLSGGSITGSLTLNSGVVVKNAGVELYYSTPFIDFHYGNSSSDYTSRIIESASGRLAIPGKLSIGGYVNDSYALATSELICNDWIRTMGNTGWYSQRYGGGWYMADDTWIRSYGNKSIYQNSGILRTDGTLQVGVGGTYFSANSAAASFGVNLTMGNHNILFNNNYGIQAGGSWVIRQFTTTADNKTVCIGVGNGSQPLRLFTTNNRVWLQNTTTYFATTSGSDKRLKKDFSDIELYEQMYMDIDVSAFRYILDDDKVHYGFMAQDVIAALKKYNLPIDSSLYGVCNAEENEAKIIHDENVYHVNYLEWVPINKHMITKTIKRVDELDTDINKRINDIYNQLAVANNEISILQTENARMAAEIKQLKQEII